MVFFSIFNQLQNLIYLIWRKILYFCNLQSCLTPAKMKKELVNWNKGCKIQSLFSISSIVTLCVMCLFIIAFSSYVSGMSSANWVLLNFTKISKLEIAAVSALCWLSQFCTFKKNGNRLHEYSKICQFDKYQIAFLKVEIFLEMREVAFLSPSKICKNLNFNREIQRT